MYQVDLKYNTLIRLQMSYELRKYPGKSKVRQET